MIVVPLDLSTALRRNCSCMVTVIMFVFTMHHDIFIYSLRDNLIGDEGAVAISEAMRTMTNLQKLE